MKSKKSASEIKAALMRWVGWLASDEKQKKKSIKILVPLS